MRHAGLVALVMTGCVHSFPQPSDKAVNDLTVADVFVLDLPQFAVMVYQLAQTPPSPLSPPDAGQGRHWQSVPDAPPASGGAAFDAYRAHLRVPLEPMQECADVVGMDIAAGWDFRCVQSDGVHVLACGRLRDGGWDCATAGPSSESDGG